MADGCFSLQIFGVPRLRDPAGQDVTPRMVKSQALLVFLALAGGAPVQRARLQDLLWSDRQPKQGRDSLKKALAEIRRSFAAAVPCPLLTDGGPVRLDPAALRIEAAPAGGDIFRPGFLEGIDILDEEFNRWLLEMRQRFDDAAGQGEAAQGEAAPRAAAPAPDKPVQYCPLFEIGVLPCEVFPALPETECLADLAIDAIIDLFTQSAIIRTYDFRHLRAEAPAGDRGPDVWLRFNLTAVADAIRIRCQFRHASSARVIWSGEQVLPRANLSVEWVEAWAARIFDEACERLCKFDGFAEQDHRAARLVFSAIDRIYRLTNCDLDAAAGSLDEAQALAETSTIYAWSAFVTAFQLEKRDGRGSTADLQEKARHLSARALELDRHNRLSVALVAHVYGFVLQDLDRATELLRPHRDEAGHSTMLADVLSTMSLYTGDYEMALRYAEIAVKVGRFNPFRYSFTTSLAMSQLMLGKNREAIASCQAALAQHPVRDGHLYEPTLRTLAAACGFEKSRLLGEEALRTLGRQGGYDARERILRGGTLSPNQQFRRRIQSGVEVLHA